MIVHTLRNLHHSSKNRNLPLITIFQYAKATSKSEIKHVEVECSLGKVLTGTKSYECAGATTPGTKYR